MEIPAAIPLRVAAQLDSHRSQRISRLLCLEKPTTHPLGIHKLSQYKTDLPKQGNRKIPNICPTLPWTPKGAILPHRSPRIAPCGRAGAHVAADCEAAPLPACDPGRSPHRPWLARVRRVARARARLGARAQVGSRGRRSGLKIGIGVGNCSLLMSWSGIFTSVRCFFGFRLVSAPLLIFEPWKNQKPREGLAVSGGRRTSLPCRRRFRSERPLFGPPVGDENGGRAR